MTTLAQVSETSMHARGKLSRQISNDDATPTHTTHTPVAAAPGEAELGRQTLKA